MGSERARPLLSKTLEFKIFNYCFKVYGHGFYWIRLSPLYLSPLSLWLPGNNFSPVLHMLSSSLLSTGVTKGFFLAQVPSWGILGQWPRRFCSTQQWVSFHFPTSTSTKNTGTLLASFREIKGCVCFNSTGSC